MANYLENKSKAPLIWHIKLRRPNFGADTKMLLRLLCSPTGSPRSLSRRLQAQWLKEEEFETFRTIKLNIIEHARGAAIQALEDTIKIWESRRRMPLYHMGPFAYKILDLNADNTV